jgi:hopanoid C-3 methylase HpnR
MRVLFVHPGPLMYTKVFLRLEPLGLECVAEAAQRQGHQVRLIDLQVEPVENLRHQLLDWRPEVVAFSLNYLANTPEVIDLAKETKGLLPSSFVVIGGHSASFIAQELLAHGQGSIDAVLRGEGEAGIGPLLEAIQHDRRAVHRVPGAVTLDGAGPAPRLLPSLDQVRPARDLVRHRRKYFLGTLDPCASVEFSRGCPWDCAFCSAWTFYGRSYRMVSPEQAVEELQRVKEPGIFIVDDVAFLHAEQGMAIAEAIARKGLRKQFYVETRSDVLLRHQEVFKLWKRIGLRIIFVGLEAIDEEGLHRFRKRVKLGKNFEALEFARSLGLNVAINIISDPAWDRSRFEAVREWCLAIPEMANISVNTPYPGTENWFTESRQLITRDYRLFDIQHAVLPTTLPLGEFYTELVRTQQVLYRKHLGWAAVRDTLKIIGGHLLNGQTNFLRSLWKFNRVYDAQLLLADHYQPVRYELSLPPVNRSDKFDPRSLYVHPAEPYRHQLWRVPAGASGRVAPTEV